MAKRIKTGKKPILDQLTDFLEKAARLLRTRRSTSGALAAAVFGGLIKLTNITAGWEYPLNMFGEIIIFFAVLFVVADIARGGLED